MVSATSSAAYTSLLHHHHHSQIDQPTDHCDTNPFSVPIFRPSYGRRNPSLSSSPSFSSNSSTNGSFSVTGDSPFSPSRTPLRSFSGVPFSWEHIPGKPKNNDHLLKKESSTLNRHLLPLPPAGTGSICSGNSFRKGSKEAMDMNLIISPKKYNPGESFIKDPFIAALMECSKDDYHHQHHHDSSFWKGPPSSSSSSSSKVASKNLCDRFGFTNVYASCKRTCAVSESIVFLPRQRPYNLINRR